MRLPFAIRACLWVVIIMGVPSVLLAQDGITQPPIIFSAEDFSFSGPTEISGGWQTIKLVNKGRDAHQVQFLKLPPGKSAVDFRQAMSRNNWRKLPDWVQRHGGVNAVPPGQEAMVIINLVPGEYVLICGIPDIRGRPHVVEGMISSLLVKPPAAPTPTPSADIVIVGNEFFYQVKGSLKPGARILHFRNDGEQPHEVVLIRLRPGASTQHFLRAYRPGGAPNPAGETVGGVVGLDPGLESYILLDVTAGGYGLFCFLGDPVTGAPHFSRGMWMDVEVRSEQGADP